VWAADPLCQRDEPDPDPVGGYRFQLRSWGPGKKKRTEPRIFYGGQCACLLGTCVIAVFSLCLLP
jgi:hypothetical protein